MCAVIYFKEQLQWWSILKRQPQAVQEEETTKQYAPGWARTTNLSVNSRTR